MKLRSALILLAIALLVIPLAACGGDDGATQTTAAGSATTAAAGASATEPVDTIASPGLLDAIAAGAKEDAVVRPQSGRVVSSASLPNIYFVAVIFSSSMENHEAVWATNDPEGTGTIWAVDKIAKDNTTFTKGDDADPKITMDDPAAPASTGQAPLLTDGQLDDQTRQAPTLGWTSSAGCWASP